jgi:trans-aconitate 2-methyltransferase
LAGHQNSEAQAAIGFPHRFADPAKARLSYSIGMNPKDISTDSISPAVSREWDSAAYNRISAPQFAWGMKVVQRLALRGDETVLDAGCGTGRLTREILGLLPSGHVVALDVSKNMLHAARENLEKNFGDRVEYVAADLLDLPFQSKFDGIFSTAAFHWVPDHSRLFNGLFAALKSGGWLIAQCGGARNLNRFLTRLSSLVNSQPFFPYLKTYTNPWVFSDAETAKKRLQSAGFVNVDTSLEPAPTRFETPNQYAEFVSKVIVHRHLEQLPTEALRCELLQALAAQGAKDSPPYQLDYWRLNLAGNKPL